MSIYLVVFYPHHGWPGCVTQGCALLKMPVLFEKSETDQNINQVFICPKHRTFHSLSICFLFWKTHLLEDILLMAFSLSPGVFGFCPQCTLIYLVLYLKDRSNLARIVSLAGKLNNITETFTFLTCLVLFDFLFPVVSLSLLLQSDWSYCKMIQMTPQLIWLR